MRKKVMFVGLDVDDKSFHAGLIAADTGENLEFVCKPTSGALAQKLKKFEAQGYELKICYEACHLGYGLCRDLQSQGWECSVISPSDIPRAAGDRVKTDRLDATKLARYLANGLLKSIYIPTPTQEAERDLIRARRFMKEQTGNIKRFILSACRRVNLDYRKSPGEEPTSHYWSARHRQWLEGAIGKIEEPSARINISALLFSLKHLEEQLRFYDQEIEKLASKPHYEKGVRALNCFRGLDTLSSMTILAELGTMKRFSHPRQLTSYVGMDIAEYSSGGKERKLGITKMGNVHLRRTIVESSQFSSSRIAISKPLKKRRELAPKLECITIADRCMNRLYKRSHHLAARGKPANKIKVACARETWGFIWEALRSIDY